MNIHRTVANGFVHDFHEDGIATFSFSDGNTGNFALKFDKATRRGSRAVVWTFPPTRCHSRKFGRAQTPGFVIERR
jgi:hypothetical protein